MISPTHVVILLVYIKFYLSNTLTYRHLDISNVRMLLDKLVNIGFQRYAQYPFWSSLKQEILDLGRKKA